MEESDAIDLLLGVGLPSQTIQLQGTNPYESVALDSKEVYIHPSIPNHTDSSPSLKVRNIVDAQWEKTFHKGNLIALDDDGTFLAYGMRVPGKTNGVVRVIHRPTNQRFLLKGYRGVIRDVQFSRTKDALYIAAIDEFGIAMVHEIVIDNGLISHPLLLQIERPALENSSEYRRIVWCPYIPDPEASSGVDPAKLLLLLSDNQAEVWHIPTVCENQSSPVTLSPYDSPVNEGLIRFPELGGATLVDGSLSPDGSAVAISSTDGNVYFFQFNFGAWTANKVHVWKPHGGKPLSSLHFLDDFTDPKPDEQFWRYAITGANNNSEIKLWYCDTWKCHQTIHLQSNTNISQLKVKLDRSASFLLLSDIQNRLLYVFNLRNDENQAAILSMTQFNLRFPMISYHVLHAGWKKHKRGSYGQNGEDAEADRDEEDEYQQVVVIDLVFIQPNSLQECQVVFQPILPSSELYRNTDSLSTLSKSVDANTSLDISNISEVELTFQSATDTTFNTSVNPLENHYANSSNMSSLLLPPDAFHSPSRTGAESAQSNKTVVADNTPTKEMFTAHDQSAQDLRTIISPRPPSKTSNVAPATNRSGGSSPSREVQDILNPQPLLPQTLEPPAHYSPGVDNGSALHNVLSGLNSNISVHDNSEPTPTNDKLDHLFSALELNRSSASQEKTMPWSSPLAVEPKPTNRELNIAPVIDNQQLASLDRNMALLIQLMQNQQDTIASLRKQVQESVHGTQELHKEMEEMRQNSACASAEIGRVETLLQKDREQNQQVISSVAQTVASALNFKVENLIKSEMAAISAEFARSLEPLRKQFNAERAQFLGSLEGSIKEQVSQLVKSKNLMDEWSQTLNTALQPIVLRCVKETLASHVIPNFEKSCQNLFGQLNDVMNKGLKELFQSMEAQMEKTRRVQEKSKDQVREQMAAATEKLSNVGEQMKALINVEMGVINQAINKLPEQVNGRVSASVKDEIARLNKEQKHNMESAIAALHQAVVRSGTPVAGTPVPTPGTPNVSMLKQLLATGRTVEAFQAALSASDLRMVTSVCELVDPQTLFSSQVTPLPQNVLLSLVQQLSSDLSTDTDLKLRYLKEALMVLDPEDMQLRGHVHGVVSFLMQQLDYQLSLQAKSLIVKDLRMLRMMAQSILSKL